MFFDTHGGIEYFLHYHIIFLYDRGSKCTIDSVKSQYAYDPDLTHLRKDTWCTIQGKEQMSRKLLLIGSISLLIALCVSGCHIHLSETHKKESSDSTYMISRVIENILYTDENWPQPLHADLYLPSKTGLRPAVIMIHGGGWARRSRNDMTKISRKLAQHGYAVLNVSYRFAPTYQYPAQLHDLQQALQWITKNAKQYQIDITRINTWGYSSGAHLAALFASFKQNNTTTSDLMTLPEIRAVVAGGIPSDLRKYDSSPIVTRFMGGDLDEIPERYAEASPVFHVSSDTPPVFLYHGQFDFLVTEDQARDYYQALIAADVDAELYLHRWLGHMTMFLFGNEAVDRAIAFLNRQNA